MQCHKPGHRAPARCVSALLAAGALLATAADHLGGSPSQPAIQTTALGIPAVFGPAQPSPAMADPLPPQARGSLPARPARQAAKARPSTTTRPKARPVRKSIRKSVRRTVSRSRTPSRARPAPARHTNAYLLAHLPRAKNPKAAKAVHEALSLLGIPYRWGGTTRAGFDCSGFTQYVWAAAGVRIPRTVRAQARAGTHISLRNVEPGDLVVFYPTQHHVGIYVGNGLVIDSPHPGSRVRPDPVRSMPVSVVVRVHT